MSEVNGAEAGTKKPNDDLSIDFALAEWIYHRDRNDQGLSLNDILDNPNNSEIDGSLKTLLEGTGLTVADDGFIYNPSDGFVGAVG